MKRFRLPYIEFYITNVCNLTCQGCNRFNNYKFSGFQRWNDYKDLYTQWATELDIGNISILGGEPLLHPEFMLWLTEIRKLWPRTPLSTVTNGYRLNQIDGLYEFIQNHCSNTSLSVGIHNKCH
jgi:MoaA/NifB/PqqE/SkfB family radical SAM enzyme